MNTPKQPTIELPGGGGRASSARILLADDNPAFVDCVAEVLIDAEYDVIGVVADGTHVLAEANRLRPDVLILDISMGDVSGIELGRLLQESGFAGKVVYLTVHEDPDFLRAAIGAGGSAYVVKSRLDLDLLPAVQAALGGRMFVSASLQHEVAKRNERLA